MQDICIICASTDAIAKYSALGRWHHRVLAGKCYALLEPATRGARSILSADSALTVLPSLNSTAPLAAAVTTAISGLAVSLSLTTDTPLTLRQKLHAAGVDIFDPEI